MDFLKDHAVVCGGGGSTQTTCLQFLPNSTTAGSWVSYGTLAQSRYLHGSHVFQDQLILMGDHHRLKPRTTEILGKGLQFNLQHDYW